MQPKSIVESASARADYRQQLNGDVIDHVHTPAPFQYKYEFDHVKNNK